MSLQFVRLERINERDRILKAARHNLREIQRELGPGSNIDIERSDLNEVLAGPSDAAEVASAYEGVLRDAGIEKVRKNAVLVVEAMVSLPSGCDGKSSAFFRDSLAWIRRYLGGVVFSAVVHRDEAQQHMHVLIVPIIEGRLRGRDYIGDINRLQTIQGNFFASVASRYGLTRPPPKRRVTVAQKNDTAAAVVEALRADRSLLDDPRVLALVRDAIAKDPVEIARAVRVPISPVHARPKTQSAPVGQTAIAVPVVPSDSNENAIAVSSGVIHTNRYPVYSGFSYPQDQSAPLH